MLDAGPAGGDTHTGQAGESVEWAGGVGGNPRPHTSEITSFQLAVGKQEYGSTVTQFFKTSQKFNFVGVFLFLNWHTIKNVFPSKYHVNQIKLHWSKYWPRAAFAISDAGAETQGK